MRRNYKVIAAALATVALLLAAVGSKVDFTLGTTPGNPAAGKVRLWANTATGYLECLSSSGTSCFASASAGVTLIAGGTNVISGALAANTKFLITADVTQNTSAIALSQNNVTIECVPGVKITFATSTVDGFDISGDDDTIRNCILDGNSAQTKPVVNITGNRTTLEGNTFQNMGVTSPSTANVYVNGGSGHRIRRNYWPSITDAVLFIENTTSSTTISDIIVESNYVAALNPGSAALNGFFAKSVISTSRLVVGVQWLSNTMYCQGSNTNCMGQNMDISATGQGPGRHTWRDNKVILTGSTADAFHLFGNYHNVISGNAVLNDNSSTFAVSKYYSFGDSYHSAFQNNIIKNPAGFYTGDFVFADNAYNVISGNIADGGTGNSTTAGCFYLFSVSGINSHNLVANNVCRFEGAFASPGIRIESGTGSFTTVDNQVIGNHIDGTGTSGQIGVQLVETTGTMSGTYVAGNYFSNLPTAISIGSGVDTTKLGDQYFETVTTQVSNSGSNTFGATKTVYGTCVLGTSCAVTLAQGGFTSTSTYQCTGTDQTSAAAVKVVNTSATVATFTGTGTDTISYVCSGF